VKKCTWLLIGLLVVSACLVAPGVQRTAGGEGLDDNEACFICHSNPNLDMTFPSGETVSVFVDRDVYESSEHGRQGLACTACHTDIAGYPHEPQSELDYRSFSLDLYPVCTECHTEQIAEIQNNVHMVALAAGNPDAAVCTDCHGTHDIQRVSEAITPMNRTCGKCHSEINELYENSVHGAALIGDGNPDVPTCTDCHGSHEIIGPSNYPFRLFSPQICGDCHSDRDLMERYGVNPNVMDSYVSDFHGKTVIIFENVASDQETNKPVCIDCHGVHDILPPEDTHSSVMKENLLVTCRKCHPNASANFPDSWLSHYNPGPDQIRPVFYVKVIYWILIPLITGAGLLYVISDFVRQWIRIRREMKNV
jgi:hypothetical protein